MAWDAAMNPKIRLQWVAMLAKLTAPMDATTAAKSLADMLPMLADLPDAAFCMTSLEHVASQCRRVPTYAELRIHLGGWWRDNRPIEPTLPGPASPDQWSQKVEAEHNQAVEDWTNPIFVRAAVRSLIDHPMRGVLGPLLGSLIGRHAPDNQGMLPPEWIVTTDTPSERRDKQAPVTPRYLTPEHLAAEKAKGRPAA